MAGRTQTPADIAGNVDDDVKQGVLNIQTAVGIAPDTFSTDIMSRVKLVSVDLNPSSTGNKMEATVVAELEVSSGE